MKIARIQFGTGKRGSQSHSTREFLPKAVLRALKELIRRHEISLTSGDVKYLNGGWYVTHSRTLTLGRAVPLCRDPFPSGPGL